MKQITAIIKPFKLDEVREALADVGVTGLTDNTIILPLAAYALAILVRSVTDGLNNVDDEVRTAATAMGYGSLRRLLTVELPAAVPVVIAGLRVTTVASISLVTIGSLFPFDRLIRVVDQLAPFEAISADPPVDQRSANGSGQIMVTFDSFNGQEAELIGRADRLSTLHARAGQPHREAVPVMVAAWLAYSFAGRSPAEFTAPNQERLVP